MKNENVKPADGKLGILVVGCGAVSTTFMTGVLMARKGLAKPVGSMTQYDKMRVGRGKDKKYLHYADIVPLTKLQDIVFGWMGYPMQIKINFLCRDSILAAPLLLDLTLLMDLAARAGRYGTQRFLSFFFKSPMHDYVHGEEAVNDLFEQYVMLKNALREMGGYEADEEID